MKKKYVSIVEFLWEGKYRLGRFTLSYAGLTEDLEINEFQEIVLHSQSGIGDMRMLNRAFVYWGFLDIPPKNPINYFKNYIEERLIRGDNKLPSMGVGLNMSPYRYAKYNSINRGTQKRCFTMMT